MKFRKKIVILDYQRIDHKAQSRSHQTYFYVAIFGIIAIILYTFTILTQSL